MKLLVTRVISRVIDKKVIDEVDFDFLIRDEYEAVDGYRDMMTKTDNPEILEVLGHILEEEYEHIEELRALKAKFS